MPTELTLFLVDDDKLFLRSLELQFLQSTRYTIKTFFSGEQCIEDLAANNPDAVVLDYLLDGSDKTAMNGIETLDRIKSYNPDTIVVMLSEQDKIEVAVNCMHHGAFDYVVKSETAFLHLQKIFNSMKRSRELEQTLTWYEDRM